MIFFEVTNEVTNAEEGYIRGCAHIKGCLGIINSRG